MCNKNIFKMIFAIVAHFLLQKLFCSKIKWVIFCSNFNIIQHTQCFQTKYKIVRILTILHRWKIRVWCPYSVYTELWKSNACDDSLLVFLVLFWFWKISYERSYDMNLLYEYRYLRIRRWMYESDLQKEKT